MGIRRKPIDQEVVGNDVHVRRESFGQTSGKSRVDLNRGDWSSETSQWDGERSISGADLYDRPLCGNHQPCDRGDDGLVSQEVLAVLVTAMSIGGHCLLRGCREAGYAKRAARP